MVSTRHLTKVYDQGKPALEDVNIEVDKGEFVFLVGPSGSGKTTFIRLLLRELLPTGGEVFIGGQDVVHLRPWKVAHMRRNMGCVFQDFKLLPNKTAAENIAFALEVIGQSRHLVEEQVPEVLKLVGLEDKAENHPHELSAGEQQRISIARAFVNKPALILADEPTGNLDPATSLDIMSLLNKINRTGTTMLIATHDKEMVDSMRKRVIALEDGKIIRDQARGVYGYES